MTQHVKESTHWYRPVRQLSAGCWEAEPVMQLPGTRGSIITPDIRHARKLGLFPGVTSVIKCASAPSLESWKQRQVLMAALTLSRMDGETDDAFCSRIMSDAGDQAARAAERGTAVHAAIQDFFSTGEVQPGFAGVLRAVTDCLQEVAPDGGPWRSELCGVSEQGWGTKVDLVNETCLLDIKTKDGDLADVTLGDEHRMQLWAGGQTCGGRDRYGILFVSRTHDGAKLVMATDTDVARGRDLFLPLVAYWQAKNRHTPMVPIS